MKWLTSLGLVSLCLVCYLATKFTPSHPQQGRADKRSKVGEPTLNVRTLPLSLSLSLSLSVTMMKASVNAKYDTVKSNASASLSVNAGDLKLRASMTDATLVNGPSLNGIALSLDKPGSFVISYDVPKKDVKFQFMNTIRISDKPLNLTYSHSRNDNSTALNGSLDLDPANKVSGSYSFGSGNGKVKYTYVHGGARTFEPCYDFSNNSWDFAVSQKFYGDDVMRASYQTSSKKLGVEWARRSKTTGSFKISASFNLAAKELKAPKLSAESTWDIEI